MTEIPAYDHDLAAVPARGENSPHSQTQELTKAGDVAVISKHNPDQPTLGTVTLDALGIPGKKTVEEWQHAMLVTGVMARRLDERAPIAAVIEMGGHAGKPVERLYAVRVANLPADFFEQYALSQGREPATVDWLLLYDSSANARSAQALIGKGDIEEIGRQGSIKWEFFNAEDEAGAVPFEDNDSVSRKQIRINDLNGNLVIEQLSNNSRTVVHQARPIQAVQAQ